MTTFLLDPYADENRAEAAHLEAELVERELARRDLYYFVKRMQETEDVFEGGWHLRLLCDTYMDLVDAVIKRSNRPLKRRRVLVHMPPRHSKSLATSRCLPLWFLAKYPNKEVIVTGYGQEFINDFGSWAKNMVGNPEFQNIFPGFEIRSDSKAKNRLISHKGGGVRFAGAGSAITGRGAHLLIIDDPIKDEKDADSETFLEDLWKWYWGVARTRLHPSGGIVIMHTRWRTNDLIGRLLTNEKDKRTPKDKCWNHICLPAEAKEDEFHPKTGDLLRKKGEALHPSRYSLEELSEIRDSMPERQWLALFQGSPVAEQGNFFHRDTLQFYDPHKLPPLKHLHCYLATDFAVTENDENDATALWPFGVDQHRNLWFLPDFFHGRVTTGVGIKHMFDLFTRYKCMHIEIEPGVIFQATKPLIDIEAQKRGVYPSIVNPKNIGSKRARAATAQGMFEMGKIFIPDIQRVHFTVIPELLAFDKGEHDDLVDIFSIAARCVHEMIAPPPMFTGEERLEALGDDEDDDDDEGAITPGSYEDMARRVAKNEPQRHGASRVVSLFSADW